MKINFRKITALATSALVVGMTMAGAAAANFPAPFVSGGSANVAIVYGSSAATTDMDAGNSISTYLGTLVTGGSPTGGDSVKIEKTSDKYNLGNDASTVFVTSVDEDELPTLLAEGTYTDDDNTEYDYTQKVTLGSNLDLVHFSDSDYDDLIDASAKTPSVGIQLASGVHVLNYTLDFTTHPEYNPDVLETTIMKLMGKEYYVLDVVNGSTNKTTLLDSASSGVVTQDQTATVAGRTVTADIISSTQVLITVDGVTTNSLNTGGTYKLPDGTYVGVKEIFYNAKESGVSKVDVSIGSGKLELTDENTIEVNDVTVNEITSYLEFDSSNKLDKIVLSWSTDDEAFISPASELLMPAFEALKLSMGAHTFPEQEQTTVEFSGNDLIQLKAPIKDGVATIDLLKANSTGEFATIGKDTDNRLFTTNATSTAVVNVSAGWKYVVASWNSTAEAESYYLKAAVMSEDGVDKVRFTNVVTGDEKKVADDGDASFGSVVITVNAIGNVAGAEDNFTMSINSGGSFNTLYTAEGLKIYLPWTTFNNSALKGAINLTTIGGNGTTGHTAESFYLFFDEENKDGNMAAGDSFNVTLDDASDKVTVATVTTDGSGHEIGDTDDIEYYVISDLATRIVHDTGGDQDTVAVEYHGDQAYANLYLSAPDTVLVGGSLGDVLVTDAEVSTVSSKNLVVVGGSCINSVAAGLVGGAYCGSAWSSATGAGTGQYIIQSFSSPYSSGKVALLVAGYEATETVAAAQRLANQPTTIDTTVGNKYLGIVGTSGSSTVTKVA